MPGLDDVRLNRPDSTEPEALAPRSRLPIILVLLVCGALGVAIAVYLFQRQPAAPRQVRTETEQVVAPRAGAPLATPEPIVVPPLDESDALVRELVRRLSAHPQIAAWLTTDQLIRNFTVTVVNIADGRSPANHLKPLAPAGAFAAIPDGQRLRIDPRSFQRYNTHAAAVESIDPDGAARLYATLRPRIAEAYAELGSPHGDVDRTLQRAIARLAETPIPDGPIYVERAPASFRFVDPLLEELSSAQKQLIRMGPANARVVQDKLRAIAARIPNP
jgi:hypothetical protein